MIALVTAVEAAPALAGAAIAVTAAFLQWLRRWRWLATAIVAAASAQQLRRQQRWRRDCGGGVGAVIVVAASAQ